MLAREAKSGRAADAGRAARDQHMPAGEPAHVQ
jgi:hypothetical protein